MFKPLFCVALVLMLSGLCIAKPITERTRVRNLTAFTRLWGYIRHWYPADEIQEIDWDRFAVHGARFVSTALNDSELQARLMQLFSPLVPDLQIYGKRSQPYVPSLPIPGRVKSFWQYSGYENTGEASVYTNIRTNRPQKIRNFPDYDSAWSTLMPILPPMSKDETRHRLSFRLRKSEADELETKVYAGFQGNVVEDSLSGSDWTVKSYEFVSQGDMQDPLWLGISSFLSIQIDDIKVELWVDNDWQIVYTADFENDILGSLPNGLNINFLPHRGARGHRVEIAVEDSPAGRLLAIRKSSPDSEFTSGRINRIFAEELPWSELLDKPLVRGLNCRFPMVLQCDSERTYPVCDSSAINTLKTELTKIDIDNRNDPFIWLAGVIKYWTEVHFFFPYFEYNYLDWEVELPKTLEACLKAKDWREYKLVLRRLMCKTEDGHNFLTDKANNGTRPPFNAILHDGKWIVSKALGDPPTIPAGSEVLTMNGKPFTRLMREAWPFFSSSNPETTALRLFHNHLSNYPDSVATFTFKTPDKQRLELRLPFAKREDWQWFVPETKIAEHGNGIVYLNLCLLSDEELTEAMPRILAAKGLILDLRYYPSVSYNLICQLLIKPDSLANTYIKRYIRPNEELPRLNEDVPTWGLQPAGPHIASKVIALCSRESQSYCEAWLAALQHNHLATLVGQATAGANGNVVLTPLPGKLNAYWTGMLVRNPDKSRFFTRGVKPDIPIKRSLNDYIEGKDPELTKALELLYAEINKAAQD